LARFPYYLRTLKVVLRLYFFNATFYSNKYNFLSSCWIRINFLKKDSKGLVLYRIQTS